LLKHLPQLRNDNLLVGPEHGADAGVFRLTPELAIVQSADFFPPHVADAHAFGQIAAANALSDIYAMGATPVTALNLLATPAKEDQAHLLSILSGAREKLAEAGAVIAGGHTITARTIMFGCSVTGIVHPDQVLRNTTPRPGDVLVLTKPLGTGVLFNAHRAGKYSHQAITEILAVVATLNKTALETSLKREIHGLTDVTGFGLAGHTMEMAAASKVRIRLSFAALPFFDGAVEMYAAGVGTASNTGNLRLCGDRLEVRASLRREQGELLVDPQTSGGLLISLPAGEADDLVADLHAAGVPWATVIGEVEAGDVAVIVES